MIFLGLNNSTSKEIFLKSNQQAEKLCGLIHYALSRAVHPFMWLQLAISFSTYFFNDLQKEAFQLPLPMW